jgi:hypothetical protein
VIINSSLNMIGKEIKEDQKRRRRNDGRAL